MVRKPSITLIAFLFLSTSLLAQEICDDGIDNDMDGFVDCFDSECSTSSTQCTEFFFGNDLICTDITENPTFAMRIQWASNNQTAQNSTTPAIGDIDNDGIPEIVVPNRESRELYVLDGATGNTEGMANVGFTPNRTVAIGKVNPANSDCAWIFLQADTGDQIRAWDCNLVEQWTLVTGNDSPGLLSLADFNSDGTAELYHRNQIINALTGVPIVDGGGDWDTESAEGSSAADILPDAFCANCGGLELADGRYVWSVDIATATMNIEADMNTVLAAQGETDEFHHKYRSSWNQQNTYVSLADYNQDGNMDVITSGAFGSSGSDFTTVFFWDVINGTVDYYQDPGNNHPNGTGRINIGDTDGDGELNATYVSNQTLYSLDENLDPIWTFGIKEGSSGFTGCTLFDFNGDGAVETVYRGEDFLFIIDGAADDANRVSNTVPCVSRTYEDYPIIADVDGDGASEICVTCSFDDAQPFNPYSNSINGQVRIYESDGEQWLPARPVWNQHGYFNTHINDDLTIPQDQQSHIAVFNDEDCFGNPGDFRPLNVFLNQAPVLNSDGCPNAVFPELELVDGTMMVTSPICPDNKFDVSFDIVNSGDTELSGLMPVSFYDGDPFAAGSTLLSTDFFPIVSLQPGEAITVLVEAEGPGNDFTLFVSANDLGFPPPIPQPLKSIPECDLGANLESIEVTTTPFTIQAEKLSDNQKCVPTIPDNGTSRAFFSGTLPATEVLIWDEDFEDLTDGDIIDTGETAWTRTPASGTDNAEVLDQGFDQVFWFKDTDGEAVWRSEVIDISAFSFANLSMTMLSSSNLESDDYLRIFYSLDGGPETLWTDGDQNDDFFTALPTATVTGSTVQIIARSSNNNDNEHHYLDDIEVNGVVEEMTGEFTSGFTFYWFLNGDFTTPVFEGSTYPTMGDGDYSVVGIYDFSGCQSDTLFDVVNIQTVPPTIPVVSIVEVVDNTDCAVPNGLLRAAVIVGGVEETAGYEFTWRDANVITEVISVGATADFLPGGTYAVVATDQATGCESDPVTATVQAPAPSITLNAQVDMHVEDCSDPLSGEVSASASGATPMTSTEDIWIEDFEDNSDDQKVDNGATAWSRSPSNNNAEVDDDDFSPDKKFRWSNTDEDVTWSSETIDISGHTNVSISVTLQERGNQDNAEIMEVGYILDGAPTVVFDMTQNDFTSPRLSNVTGLNGSTLIVTVKAFSSSSNDDLYIDDVTVRGDVTTTPTFTFNWYIGQVTTALPDFTGASVTGLAPGFYTVEAEEMGTTCVSEPVTIEVLNNANLPEFTTALTDNTGCTMGNGEIETTITTPSAGDDYLLEIFNGNNTLPANLVASFNFPTVAGTDIVQNQTGLLDGFYTVRLTNETLSCADTELVEIADNSGTLMVDAMAIISDDQMNCLGAGMGDGQIEIPADVTAGLPGTFTYELWIGTSSAGGSDFGPNATGIFPGLDAGNYTVVITSDLTGCISGDLLVPVGTTQDVPTFTVAIVDDTACPGGTATGEVQFTGVQSAGDEPITNGYNFTIYSGFNTLPANLEQGPTNVMPIDISTPSDFTFSSLASGDYRIVIDNLDNGCQTISDQVVGDASVTPAFNGSPVNTPNSSCNPGAPNGFLSVTIDDGSPGGTTTGYSFAWYAGDVVNPGSEISLVSSVSNLAAGNYTVQATDDVTNCPTAPLTLTIQNVPNPPTVTTLQVNPNQGCSGAANGSLRAYAEDPGNPGVELIEADGFTFQWFLGNDTSTPLADGVDPDGGGTNYSSPVGSGLSTVSGLSGDTYTVEVTETATTCTFTETFTLVDDVELPIITGIVTTDNTGCTALFDGTATASITFDGMAVTLPDADYVFTWYDGDDIMDPVIGGEIADVLANRNGGDYTATVTKLSTGCVSDPFTTNIANTPATITFTFAETANTVCDITTLNGPTVHDGVITPTPSVGVATDYTWRWFQGQNTNPANEIPASVFVGASINASGVLTGVPGGTYTVEATSIASGCSSTDEYTLSDALVNPVISTAAADLVVTDMSVCTGGTAHPNGTIDGAMALPANVAGYDYTWYSGPSVDNDSLLAHGTNIIALKTGGGSVGQDIDLDDFADGRFIQNLVPGQYTVVVIDNDTGCESASATVTLGSSSTLPTAILNTSSDNTVCDIAQAASGVYDGAISVTTGGTPGPFGFEWFVGQNTLAANELSLQVAGATGTTTASIGQIPAGTYTLRLTDTGTGCNDTFEFTIADNLTNPVVETAGGDGVDFDITDMSVCGGATFPDGGVQLNNITGTGPYTFSWYHGSSVNAANLLDDLDDIFTQKGTAGAGVNVSGSTTATISGLDPGQYTVQVVDDANGCTSAAATFTVGATPVLPTAVLNTSSDNTVCDIAQAASGVYDGAISVTTGGTPGPFGFEWFVGQNTLAANELSLQVAGATGTTTASIGQIPAGTYTLRLTDTGTGCDDTFEFTIADNLTNPVVETAGGDGVDFDITDMSVCGGATFPDGGVQLNNITGTGPYTFSWYHGSSVNAANLLDDLDDIFTQKGTAGAGVNVSGSTTATISGLDPGQYTVQVVDDANGCTSAAATFTVGATPVLPTAVLNTSSDNTVCDIAQAASGVYDGAISVTTGGTPGPFGFEWFVGQNTLAANELSLQVAGATGTTTASIGQIPAGTYTLRLTDTGTGCNDMFEFTIADNLTNPVVVTAGGDGVDFDITDVSVCSGAVTYPDGGVQLNNITGTGPYTFSWYHGSSVNAANLLDDLDDIFTQKGTAGAGVNVSGSTTATISGLDPGQYTVQVVDDANGCTSAAATFTVGATPVLPTAVLNTSSDNTVCDIAQAASGVYDGAISVTTGGTPGPFGFEWFVGQNTLAANELSLQVAGATGTTTASIGQIPAGTYTLRLTDTGTGCNDTFEFTIADNLTNPVVETAGGDGVDFDITDMSVCGGATFPDGGVQLNNITGTGPYTFSWYHGSSVNAANLLDDLDDIFTQKGTAGAGVNVSGSTTATISGLDPGQYTVQVVDDANGCTSAAATFTVGATPVLPTAVLNTSSDNTVCDIAQAASGVYDGAISVTTGGTPGPFGFEWFVGQNTLAANELSLQVAGATGTTTASIGQIPAGTYTLRLTDTGTGCDDTFEFTIADNLTNPVVVTAGGDGVDFDITDVSVCSGAGTFPDGGVQLNNITGTGPYTFSWYHGSSVNAANLLDDLDDIFTQKGTAGAGVNVSGSTTATISGLDAGQYTVQVVDDANGCTSASATFTVGESSVLPTAVLNTSSDNTVCDITQAASGVYDGAISVTTGGTPGPFGFEWFVGQNTLAANELSLQVAGATGTTTASIGQIPAGTYTLRLTDTGTGCNDTFEFTIADNLTNPVVVTAGGDGVDFDITDVSVCSGAGTFPDGGVQLNNITGTGPYTFSWYHGSSVNAANLLDDLDDIFTQKGTAGAGVNVSGSTTATISGLDPGQYTVQVVDDANGCTSASATFTVGAAGTVPTAMLNSSTNNNVCDLSQVASGEYSGEIIVTPGGVGGFTFEWFVGQNTNPANALTTIYPTANDAGATINEIPGGTYTLLLTDNGTGCDDTFEFTITDNLTDPVIVTAGGDGVDFDIVDVSICSGVVTYPNGSVTLNNITGSGSYSFSWYHGTSVNAANLLDDLDDILTQKGTGTATPNVAGSATNAISNLDAGMYTVQIVDDGTGCTSAAVTFEVGALSTLPTAVLFSSNDNTVCDIATAASGEFNGDITVTAGGVGPFTYEWFVGQNVNPANELSVAIPTAAGTTTNAISEIPGGTYTLQLTDNGTGCVDTFEFTITDNTTDPIIDISGGAGVDFTLTQNTACLGANPYPNGGLALLDVTGVGPFTYEWYFGTGVSAPNLIDDADNILVQKGTAVGGELGTVTGSSTATIGNLDAGFYTVVATDTGTGCISDPVTLEVTDNIPAIVLVGTVLNDDYSCNVATPTGEVVAIANGGTAGFTFEWFVGTSTAPANLLPAAIATSSAVGVNGIDGLPQGTYTIRATNTTTNCFETTTVNIKRSIPVIDPNAVVNANQNSCIPQDGEVMATPIVTFSNGVPVGYTASLSYEWYIGQTASGGVDFTGGPAASDTQSALPADFYTVVVTDATSGCVSNSGTVEVLDGTLANQPTVQFTADVIPSNCDAVNGEISAVITVNPGGNNFAFEWFEGSDDFANLHAFGSGVELTTGDMLFDPPNPTVTVNNVTGMFGTAELDDVYSGLFTLVMTDVVTGCRYQETFDLGFVGVQATTTLAIDHVTGCPDNGQATVGLADQVDIAYTPGAGTFQLFETITGGTSGATGFLNSDNSGVSLTASTISGAFQLGETITGSISGATATVDTYTNGFNNGEVDDISEYDIYLYFGPGVPADKFTPYMVNGQTFPMIIDGSALAPGAEVAFSNLPAGTYTAVAREKSNPAFNPGSTSQCFSLAATDEIEDRGYEPLDDGFTITDNTVCDFATFGGNGSIMVDTRKDGLDTFEPGLFEFNWYAGAVVNPGSELQTDTDVTTSTLPNLDPGQYTVEIVRLGLPFTTITHTGATGLFTVGETINFAGGGSAIVDTDDGTTLQVNSETGTLTGLITGATSGETANTNVVTLGGGTSNGCTLVTTYTVQDDPEVHEILSATVNDIDNCNAVDGSITIGDADITDNAADYTYEWFDATMTTIGGEVTAVLANRTAGIYFVQATHDTKGCVTPLFQAEIMDVTTDPVISLTTNTIDTSCDGTPNVGNGIIDFDITNAAAGSYTFQWYTGNTATPGNEVTGAGITGDMGTVTGPYTGSLSNVNGGLYTLEVIDATDPDNGCNATATILLDEFNADITILDANITIVDQDDCSPANGSATVVLVTETQAMGAPVNVAAANYTIDWYDAPTGGSLVLGNSAALTGQVAGTYYAEATRNSTNCVMGARKAVIIADQTVDPIIQFTINNSDANCGGPTVGDGSVTAEVLINGSIVAATNYTFTWYEGTGTGTALGATVTTAGTSGTNGQTADGLANGDYTVEIEDNLNPGIGCNATATVSLAQFTPVITILDANVTIQDQEDCSPTNGSATVLSVRETTEAGGTVDVAAANYNFEWYDAAVGGSLLGSAATLNNLVAGTYYVEATRIASNCGMSIRKEVVIADMTIDPIIQFTVNNQDGNCGPATTGNGSITANVLVNGAPVAATNYTFNWYEGSGTGTALGTAVTSASTSGTNGQTADGLSDGTYTVEIIDALNPGIGCNTSAEISLAQFTPVITIADADITIVDQDDCSPVNGSATVVNVTETLEGGGTTNLAAANYNIEWYDAATGGSLLGSNATLGSLAAGTYYVEATRINSGCGMTLRKEVVIADDTIDPVIQFTVNNQDGNCGPTTNGDGSITANVLVNGAPVAATNYTFNWYEGSGTGTALGTSVASASTSGTNDQTADGLSDGTYTVEIIDAMNPGIGCNTSAEITLTQFTPVITIEDADLTIQAQDDCNPVNGSATVVNVTETTEGGGMTNLPAANYTVQWYDAPTGGSLLGSAATLGSLTAGTYYVEATRTASNCGMAIRKQVVIDDNTVNPVIQFTVNNQDGNCGPATSGDGSITAEVLINGATVSAANYTFNWYEGSGTGTALGTSVGTATTSGTNGQTADGLSDGTYTVEIIDSTNPGIGCNTSAEITLGQFTPVITIEDADLTIQAQEDCNPVNGSATVVNVTETVEGGGTTTLAAANYNIAWYDAATGGTLLGSTATLGSLSAGTYYVEATRINSACTMSARKEVVIDDNTLDPIIQFTVNNQDSFCGAATSGNGNITANVLINGAPVPAANYTFNWFEGSGTGTALGTSVGTATTSGTNGQTAEGLSDGTYTVEIIDSTNPGIGCNTTAEIVLGQFTPVITIADADVTIVDQDDCTPANGSLTVTQITETTEGGGTTNPALGNYTIEWYDAAVGGTLLGGGTSLAGQVAGTYYIDITNTATGCVMAQRKEVVIDDLTVNPIIQFASVEDSFCGAVTSGDGSVTATVLINGVAQPAANYTFTWYEGSGTAVTLGTTVGTAAAGGLNGEAATGLSNGTYTLVADDNINPGIGCGTQAEITLGQFNSIISILDTDVTVVDQDDCAPVNGSITVANITETLVGGGTATNPVAGYTIEFYDMAVGGSLLATAPSITGQAAGTYYIEVTNNTTGCVMTNRKEVVIEDNTVNPIIQFAAVDDSFCGAAATGNGMITASVLINGVAQSPADYAFTWYEGSGTGTTLGTTVGTAVTGGTNGEVASGLSDGTYTLVVDDNTNPGIGCGTQAEITLGQFTPVITILDAQVDVVDNDNCSPANGSITVNNVQETTLGGGTVSNPASDYTIEWYDMATGGTLLATTDAYTNIAGGTYYAELVNNNTGCTMPNRKEVVVEDISVNPTIVFNITQEDSSCDPGNNGDGIMTVGVRETPGGPIVTADYQFEWFRGLNNTTTALNGSGSATVSVDNLTASGLSNGFYTVRVTDLASPNNDCQSVASFEMTEDTREVTITAGDVTVVDNTNCSDGFTPFTGSIKIDMVREDGVPVPVTDYSFTWNTAGGGPLPGGAVETNVDGTRDLLENIQGGTYEVLATNNTTLCATTIAIQIDVDDVLTEPTIAFSMTPNRVCDMTFPDYPNGSLTATAQFMGSGFEGMNRFDFEWFDGSSTGSPSLGAGVAGPTDNISLLTNEEPGFYTLEVTDRVTGCTVSSTITIDEVLDIPVLDNPTANVVGSTFCAGGGDGMITINDADISGGDLGLYRFQWISGVVTNPPFATITNPGATSISQSNLTPGTYFVVATNTATGCQATPARFEVPDLSFNPMLSFTMSPNIGCGAETPNGSLTVLADGVDDTDPDYNFQWYVGVGTGGATVSNPDGGQTSTITGQTQGSYTVEVTRLSTMCVTVQTFEIDNEQFFPVITNGTTTDQTDCIGNGSAEVTAITYQGATPALGDFTIRWYDDDALTSMVGMGPTLINQVAGSYWATAEHIATGCLTVLPAQFDIGLNQVFPLVTTSEVQVDDSCDGVNGTGSLNGLADGLDDTDPDYTFQWYTGATAMAGNEVPIVDGGQTSTIINQLAGIYTLEVNRISTGCTITQTAEIASEPQEPIIIGTDASAMTNCTPGNGSVEVTGLNLGAVGDYTYFWFNDPSQFTAPNFTPIQSGPSATLTDLGAGSYYVIAEHTTLGCRTALPAQIDVIDSSFFLSPINITQTAVSLQTNCDPTNPNGSLTVAANGISDTGFFTYTWRDENGAVIEPNNFMVSGLTAGNYTVEVTSLSTGCVNQRTFAMIDDNPELLLRSSISANTHCENPSIGVTPNGRVAASVINGALGATYDYYWFTGTDVPTDVTSFATDPNLFGTEQFLDSIPSGTYTVIAIDQADNFCVTSPRTVVVPDESEAPPIMITQEAPLTNCDPLRPNAELSVDSPGNDISFYSFAWYEGTDTSGTPFLNGQGRIFADSLTATTYTVEITDLVQGCTNTASITIEDATEPVPVPELDELVHRTNCVFPDGSIVVTIEGRTSDYTFEWFTEADETTPFTTGLAAGSLDVGTYLIIAENNNTGCRSEALSVEILDESRTPLFTVETTPSVCSLNNGTATIRFDQVTEIDSIVWDLGNGDLRYDFTLNNATDGQGYRVFIRDKNLCEYETTFNISTDVIVYNGVSDNGDGLNDWFIIDCIDRFENATVKIFNRAGQLVWETGEEGYINGDDLNSFNGFANKGVSFGSERLPEGTYYYLIDRNEFVGEDDILQGFLELVR